MYTIPFNKGRVLWSDVITVKHYCKSHNRAVPYIVHCVTVSHPWKWHCGAPPLPTRPWVLLPTCRCHRLPLLPSRLLPSLLLPPPPPPQPTARLGNVDLRGSLEGVPASKQLDPVPSVRPFRWIRSGGYIGGHTRKIVCRIVICMERFVASVRLAKRNLQERTDFGVDYFLNVDITFAALRTSVTSGQLVSPTYGPTVSLQCVGEGGRFVASHWTSVVGLVALRLSRAPLLLYRATAAPSPF